MLIFDEVISGFGRSGAFTGLRLWRDARHPELCQAGHQRRAALGGVIASKEIYDTFMAAGGPEYMLEFPHGYTYSAHPVACAAGIAALDILQKEDMIGRVKALARTSRTPCTA